MPRGPTGSCSVSLLHFFLITLVRKARNSKNIYHYAFKLTYFKYSSAPALWGAEEIEMNGSISTLEELTAQK